MRKILFATLLFGIFISVTAKETYAAVLSLDPASKSVPVNTTFEVKLLIDTEGESTTSTDAIMLFDDTILSVVSIEDGDNGSNPFFPDVYSNISPGKLYIGASVKDPIDTSTGIGTVATITFKGDAQGTSDVVFDCTAGKTSDTNISKSDKNQTDIVVCSALANGRYTIGTGGIATPTPGIAPSVTYTPTPTPTMPVSGTVEATIGIAGLGMLLLLGGFGSRVFLKI